MATKSRKGFTLIELMLYVGIAGGMLLVLSIFLSIMLQSRVKAQTIGEVEQQGVMIMQSLTQAIRNSTAIAVPAIGAASSTLSLTTASSTNNPTILGLASSTIQISESGRVVGLNNQRIVASGLQFSNYARSGTKDLIRIQFTLASFNPGGKSEYSYQETFYGSAQRRQ